MNYTKGPWKSRSKDQCVYGPAGVTICHCGDNGIYGDESYSISKQESYGNARLIAAAPDLKKERDELKEINREMLNALVYITEFVETWEPDIEKLCAYIPRVDKYIAIIEKATGKTWAEIKEAGE